ARLNFVENRIAPLCKRLEAGIQPIIDRFASSSSSSSSSKVRGEFHIKSTPVMQSAQRARIDSGLKLFGLGVPLNVVNTVLDLGLPRLPHGDTSFLSSRFKELSSAESPEPAEEAAAEAEHAQRCLRLLSPLSAPARDQC